MRYATDSDGDQQHGDQTQSTLKLSGQTKLSGQSIVGQKDHASQSSEAAHCFGDNADDCELSLRDILPGARSFDGSDILFHAVIDDFQAAIDHAARHPVADSGAKDWSGKLVVYRSGTADPVEVVCEAMARGAAGILTEQLLPSPLPQFIVGDVVLAAAKIDATRLGRPDRKLLTVGVIGSAGKTTTSLLVAAVLRGSGIRTAYHNDLGDCDGLVQDTPDHGLQSGKHLIRQIADAVDSRCQAMVIELDEADLRHGHHDAIEFDVLITSSASSGATDFGPNELQCALDQLTAEGVVICNADDSVAIRIIRDAGVRMVTHGLRGDADVTGKLIDQSGGMSTLLVTYDDSTIAMETSLCGWAMASNHLAAICFGILIDRPVTTVIDQLSLVQNLPGRYQQVNSVGRANVILDVASTATQVGAALRTARSMRAGGKLWCVLAIEESQSPETVCQFGHLLERFADHAIVTTRKNQKTSFLQRSHQVLDGVQECAAFRLVADQDRAIQWTMQESGRRDVVLVIHPVARLTAKQQRTELESITRQVQTAKQTVQPSRRPKLHVIGVED